MAENISYNIVDRETEIKEDIKELLKMLGDFDKHLLQYGSINRMDENHQLLRIKTFRLRQKYND